MVQKPVIYRKVGLVGPESVGKSTLALQLARHFGGTVVSEYARDYVASLARNYNYADVCHIAEQNVKEASSYHLMQAPVFFDTELIITKVWLQEVFHRCPDWLTTPIPDSCMMDYYLLLSPDLPWQSDSVRENGSEERRQQLFELYLNEIIQTNRPYSVISGTDEQRLYNAVKALSGN